MAKIALDRRSKIRARIRNKVVGTLSRPRLSVFRSNRQIYAQIIDDAVGQTLVGLGTFKMDRAPKKDQSYELGLQIAKLAIEKKIEQIVFDRGGYVYHGRVKALARGLREGGLKF